ncbi:helix-turn-helix domain-containing protein [Candidatus Uhrbacteria bacterium]|nr:helix-turn-helix domain-containing protein [Candidatus Uhrbacteria bacterium]
MKHHIIQLSARERKTLRALTKKGRRNARELIRARILLQSDAGKTDQEIAHAVDTAVRTVERVRKHYAESGLKRALYDAPRPGAEPALNVRQEAHLVAIACSDPPAEHTHWTLELLRERLLHDKVVTAVSIGTVHARLTERGIKPWTKKNVVHSEGG